MTAAIDRQTVKPALLVLMLAVLLGLIFPYIDSKTSYHDPVRRGEVVALAGGITLVPAAGWNLATGAIVGRTRSVVGGTATTELVNDGVKLEVQAAPFAGSPSALLSRVNQIRSELDHTRGNGAGTRRYPVTTRQGATGDGEDFVGVDKDGSVVAFVFRLPARASGGSAGTTSREGVEIVVSGPSGPMSRRRGDIVAMIRSVRTTS